MISIGNVPPDFASELILEIQELLAQPEQEPLSEQQISEGTRAMGKNTISLRDHFAGLAMQSLLTKASITVGSDSVAMAAYHVAHQMLKERSRGEKRDDT